MRSKASQTPVTGRPNISDPRTALNNLNTEPLAQLSAAAAEHIPARSGGAPRTVELTLDARSTARDLVQVIDKDPVLTVQHLMVVLST